MDMMDVVSGLAGFVFGVVATMLTLSYFYVSKADCKKTVEGCSLLRDKIEQAEAEWCSRILEEMAVINKKSDVHFKMLRSVIVHLPELTPEARAKILNLDE